MNKRIMDNHPKHKQDKTDVDHMQCPDFCAGIGSAKSLGFAHDFINYCSTQRVGKNAGFIGCRLSMIRPP